ncbi:MAG: CHAT domain-containing protein [Acidobacteriota bacterium]
MNSVSSALLAAFWFMAAPDSELETGAARTELRPGETVEHPLEPPGGEHGSIAPTSDARSPWPLVVRVDPSQRAVLLIEQISADVTVEARWGGQDRSWRVDSPLDFDGVEVLLLPPMATGEVELRVTGHPPGSVDTAPAVRRAHPGRWRARLEILPATSRSRPSLEALGLLTAAGRAWAEGTGDGRRRALAFYRRAAEHQALAAPRWRLLRAQATYAAGVLHRLLGDGVEGEPFAQRARRAFEDLADPRRVADAWNELGLMAREDGRLEEATSAFTQALRAVTPVDAPFRRARIRGNQCLIHLMESELEAGVDCYGAALRDIRPLGDLETQSVYLLNTAQAARVLGRPDRARTLYREALSIQRRRGLQKLVGQTLNNLAGLDLAGGRLPAAIDAYAEAAEIFEHLGDARWHGRSLHNLAAAEYRLGDFRSARRRVDEALRLHREHDYRRGAQSALKILGHIETAVGKIGESRRAYLEAREIARLLGDDTGEALAATFLARLDIEEGYPASAVPRLERAVATLDEASRVESSGMALSALGQAHLELGQLAKADEAFDRALRHFERSDLPLGRGLVHRLRAERSLRAGELDLALGHLEAATAELDRTVEALGSSDRRAFFSGTRRRARELHIETLVDLGRVESALEAAEAARAWGLRTALADGDSGRAGNRPAGAPPLHLGTGGAPGTAWLHFWIGSRRSFLFLSVGDRLEAIPLPSADRLEGLGRGARADLLAGGDGVPLRRLADAIFGSAPGWLKDPGIERLALILDGPLHAVPLAALPHPDGGPLVEHLEVVRIQSGTVLDLDRRRRQRRSPATGFVAALVDPVFSRGDLRIEAAPDGDADDAAPHLPRLRGSAREAAAALKAAGGAATIVAEGFGAHRDWLLGAHLDDFRILHFATHARIDEEVAARSGLLLSAFDRDGEPRPSLVSAAEIRGLKLRADLIVLSACGSALGPQLPGEGFRGLAEAFVDAGASRVIASLWPVADGSTADLMEVFYRELESGARYAEALRRAQLALRADGSPASAWASFVLIGDWRGDGQLAVR